jgi:hypothetical protein
MYRSPHEAPAIDQRLTARVTITGQDATLAIHNLTLPCSFTKTVAFPAPDTTSAEWIAEAPVAVRAHGVRTPWAKKLPATINVPAVGTAYRGIVLQDPLVLARTVPRPEGEAAGGPMSSAASPADAMPLVFAGGRSRADRRICSAPRSKHACACPAGATSNADIVLAGRAAAS